MELDVDGKPWQPLAVDRTLAAAVALAANDRKDFAFVHLLAPHSPYYHRADCTLDSTLRNRSWNNYDSDFGPYRDAYVAELQCVNARVLRAINEILSASQTPPILILEGDHGPPEIRDRVLAENHIGREFRFSVLSAAFGPPEVTQHFSAPFFTVNTFRAVLAGLGIAPELRPLSPRFFFWAKGFGRTAADGDALEVELTGDEQRRLMLDAPVALGAAAVMHGTF